MNAEYIRSDKGSGKVFSLIILKNSVVKCVIWEKSMGELTKDKVIVISQKEKTMVKKVRALVMVEPGRFKIREFPYPEITADSALIKMELSGICGTDKHMYNV